MKIIVGLGNPGDQYKNTRHNIGFKILEMICSRYGFGAFSFSKNYNAEIAEGNIGMDKFIAIKPMTYMNKSGGPVSMIASFYKIAMDDIIVVYDDIDLDTARVRVRKGGSAGGHNGIKDLIARLGNEGFRRLKIGVGRPVHKDQVSDYVLGNFKKEELDEIYQKEAEIISYFEKWNMGKI